MTGTCVRAFSVAATALLPLGQPFLFVLVDDAKDPPAAPPPTGDQYWRGRRSDEKSTTPRSQASASPQPSSASAYASSTPGTRRSNGPSVRVRSVLEPAGSR